jgi:3-deoxy-7-phosphoheptulonate synthase
MTTTIQEVDTPVHEPPWDRPDVLDAVLGELNSRPPLVDPASCLALLDALRSVADGHAFLLQAGDCAERFADCAPHRVSAKSAMLHRLGDRLESDLGAPVVRVGRMAGQYAKPRSCAVETLRDGTVLPTYRGDAINAPEPTPAARTADPRRLLEAYDCAARVLSALSLDRLLLGPGAYGLSAGLAPIYASHEALLLDYEAALTRATGRSRSRYGLSAHLLWIGDRTRQVDGGHLQFAATVDNPVGVKIGPTATPADVREITQRLTARRPPGRLTLISRLGVDRVTKHLPAFVAATGDLAGRIIWSCDPMHGNTLVGPCGRKTRIVDDLVGEIEQTVDVLRRHDVRLGGLHLEVAPDPVTECLDSAAELAADPPLPRYETACDPRLSPHQAERVVRRTAELLADS